MEQGSALKSILFIAIFGMLFSGYLTYQELFAPVEYGAECVPLGEPGTILGYPPCVYGFFMYLIVAGLAAFGLRGPKKN